jgi:colanic acid biosynthesis glycosyl transferase WcaI
MARDAAEPEVLFVTQQYAPEPIGSAPYIAEMAEFVAQRGVRVEVLTCRPHYPENSVPEAYRDGSRDDERLNGVDIVRVRPWLPRRRGFIGRTLSEYAFLLRGAYALVTRRVRRAPTVVSLCPSILAVVLGTLASQRGARHVAIVHDIQSGLAEALGMVRNGWLLRAMRWLEHIALNRTDLVLVLSDEMGTRLRAQGVTVPIETLPIWVDTEFIRPTETRCASTVANVLYSGNLGRKQALDQVIDMADRLARHKVPARVVLRGNGSEAARLATEVRRRCLDNVSFAPLVAREQLPAALAEGDVHLVPQERHAADFAVPSKIFGIMSAGRPFVAAAPPHSLLWRLCEESGAFLCVPSGDVEALSDAVERLAADSGLREKLGRNGRAYTVAHHDRIALLERFQECLGRGRAQPERTADGCVHVLIFEPDARGHAREWMEHLICRIERESPPQRATIAVPEELADQLRPRASEKISIRAMTYSETKYCNHRNLAMSGFARWWTARRHVLASGATHVLSLGIDHLTLPLGLGLSFAGRPVTGILFRPCTHYAAMGCGRPTTGERIRDLRKNFLTGMTAGNASVQTIFSLDPYFPEFAVRRYHNGHKFVPIWDPAFPAPPPDGDECGVAADLPEDRTTFILFGEVTERKGIFPLLEAASRLADEIAKRTTIIIAGRIDPPIRDAAYRAVDNARRAAPKLCLKLIDRRLASGELSALVSHSDVVLLPYQRFVGSSGVLLWAARFERPVICQEYGLIGMLTRNFGLGTTVDTGRPDALAIAIGQVVKNGTESLNNRARVQDFLADRGPEVFARALLGAW